MINEGANMKIRIVMMMGSVLVLSGCATTKPSADEQLAKAVQQMEETNSTAVIYQQRQSRGLLGDMMDGAFKTVTGDKQ
ncbi:MAG: hypothetical protein RBQ96_06660 [Candidatus Methanomethylophilaceae archaeon]|jgi:uncharacterized lipoprotein YajG|nr:hypothetical protein [Sulfurovum sp.]MDY0252752.1 hypothetical protein [Candidatus Methanomethylophilaceae archaeon]